MIAPIYQHHRGDSPTWAALVDAANLEHDGDWPVVQVSLASGAELVDWQEKLVDEVIYAQDHGDGQWHLDYSTDADYAEHWDLNDHLYEPANIITPGMLNGLFGEELAAGATVRFQAVVVDTYDCEDCHGQDDDENAGQEPVGFCDHTLGWALIWAVREPETVQ